MYRPTGVEFVILTSVSSADVNVLVTCYRYTNDRLVACTRHTWGHASGSRYTWCYTASDTSNCRLPGNPIVVGYFFQLMTSYTL